MAIVCSSIGMEAVISRVEREVLMVIGWSSVAWDGAQAAIVDSSRATMSGETYFSVQGSSAMLSWREALSRHHSFARVGR